VCVIVVWMQRARERGERVHLHHDSPPSLFNAYLLARGKETEALRVCETESPKCIIEINIARRELALSKHRRRNEKKGSSGVHKNSSAPLANNNHKKRRRQGERAS
jgi:hypothetical protein